MSAAVTVLLARPAGTKDMLGLNSASTVHLGNRLPMARPVCSVHQTARVQTALAPRVPNTRAEVQTGKLVSTAQRENMMHRTAIFDALIMTGNQQLRKRMRLRLRVYRAQACDAHNAGRLAVFGSSAAMPRVSYPTRLGHDVMSKPQPKHCYVALIIRTSYKKMENRAVLARSAHNSINIKFTILILNFQSVQDSLSRTEPLTRVTAGSATLRKDSL